MKIMKDLKGSKKVGGKKVVKKVVLKKVVAKKPASKKVLAKKVLKTKVVGKAPKISVKVIRARKVQKSLHAVVESNLPNGVSAEHWRKVGRGK